MTRDAVDFKDLLHRLATLHLVATERLLPKQAGSITTVLGWLHARLESEAAAHGHALKGRILSQHFPYRGYVFAVFSLKALLLSRYVPGRKLGMIYRLEIENFYSVRDRQVIDLTVGRKVPDEPGRLVPLHTGSEYRAPRVIAIYGANASGKSNVLRAIAFLSWPGRAA